MVAKSLHGQIHLKSRNSPLTGVKKDKSPISYNRIQIYANAPPVDCIFYATWVR